MSSGEQIIAIVGEAVQSLGLRLMMVGAASRDFWLKQFQVRANIRTTHDVDLACWVATWEEYQTLMDLLLAGGKLRKDSRGIKHRLWLRDEIAVDLVPFGGIENAHGEFAWPPHFDRTVNGPLLNASGSGLHWSRQSPTSQPRSGKSPAGA